MKTGTLQIVVIGYVWPEPDSSAAGRNMLSIITQFVQIGHRVTFMTAAADSVHSSDLEKLQVNSESISLNCSSFNQRIEALTPDIVIFDRYMTEEQFSWRVKEACPMAVRVLNTEDLHSLRHARHEAIKREEDAKQADLSSPLAQREIAAILRSDLTLVISRAEYTLLTDFYRVPKEQLFYFPLQMPHSSIATPHFSARKDIVTIGNFRHAPNWDAVLQLRHTIWPALRKALPHVNLHIYGAYPPKKATQLHSPKLGFYVEGWAESAQDVISQARLLIAPLRFGAGIKGKLLEAMHVGTPTVTTWIGAEGIIQDAQNESNAQHTAANWGGAICDTLSDFVEQTERLYNSEQDWRIASELGREVLDAYYTDKECLSLTQTITSMAKDIAQHRQPLFLQRLLWHHTLTASKYMSQWIEAKNAPPL